MLYSCTHMATMGVKGLMLTNAGFIENRENRGDGGQLPVDGRRSEELGSSGAGERWWKSAGAGRRRNRSSGAKQMERQRTISASQEKRGRSVFVIFDIRAL